VFDIRDVGEGFPRVSSHEFEARHLIAFVANAGDNETVKSVIVREGDDVVTGRGGDGFDVRGEVPIPVFNFEVEGGAFITVGEGASDFLDFGSEGVGGWFWGSIRDRCESLGFCFGHRDSHKTPPCIKTTVQID
jgi:hypothetical protein